MRASFGRLTYGYNVWLEATMLPFLGVLAIFLFVRYATNAEVNKRFRILTLSTFIAASFEVISTLLIDGWGDKQFTNLFVRTIFYAVVNFNAYHLMRYVQAYVSVENKYFDLFNKILLTASVLMLIMNLIPKLGGFFFSISPMGGLLKGNLNTLCRSVFTLYFITMACWLQFTHRQYYIFKSQFVIMNILGGLFIFSFLAQYLFVHEILFTYSMGTLLLFIIFFYYEAPTYRRMANVEIELEQARILAEKSTLMTNAANRAKSDFLANTSHEIRTPMNAILGMNEIILKESKDSEIRKAALNIRKAGNHLLSIINNILDISKIESGKMDLYIADYHLWQLLKDIEENMFEIMRDKKIKFILDIDKKLPEHLYGDEERIKQVIMNLLDNSVKYTEKGSIILKVQGEVVNFRVELEISVHDTGIGIRKEDLRKLFNSFERVNLAETQNIHGAGLGLTLVRYLLGLMGGTIKAESEYGKGSTFTINLSQHLSQDGFTGTIHEYETLLEELAENSEDDDENTDFTCPDAKILIVDDTPVNIVVAKGMLSESKAHIETAESGEEALKLLKANHYDIIFLDHRMPGMDGIETLKIARETESPSRLSVFVALTANSGAGLRDEYISYGFNDYLSKPIKSDALKKILSHYLPKNLKIKI